MTQEQFQKLDKCYFDFDINSNCEEETVDARKLICPQRFDLYANLLYIDHKVKGVKDEYALSVYKERTRTITGFKMSEAQNSRKNSFEDFLAVFDELIDDIRNGKYDTERTLIPVDKNYVLMDGAHRVSCAAYFGKEIKILRFVDYESPHMSSDFLRKNIIPEKTLDAMALESCRWHDNLFMLIFWPKSFLQPETLDRAYRYVCEKSVVVYQKEYNMSYSAIRNLMIQMYGHMDWVGSIENDFAATYTKADEVWDGNGKCSFILIQAPSCDFVLKMKSEIREMFGIGLASIHTTDNIRETKIVANAIYNPNSMFFLHHAKPTKFKKSYRMTEEYKKILIDNHCDLDKYIIDTSMVLSIFGLREASDLYYYTIDKKRHDFFKVPNIEEHDDSQKDYYDISIVDLIESPFNYFVFNELKFVNLDRLLDFKNRRYEANHDIKDKHDMMLIRHLRDKSKMGWQMKYNDFLIVCRRRIRMIHRSYRQMRKDILVSFHLYEPLRSLKKQIKK